jgi:glucan phosphoethanolaminetransferase (alkaline phosphatase superfamily)
MLAELLSAFSAATIVICTDHGDCWGEDGLWEHGISHEMTLTVPLIMRVSGQGIGTGLD